MREGILSQSPINREGVERVTLCRCRNQERFPTVSIASCYEHVERNTSDAREPGDEHG
jgi:hypothetical protein